MTAYDKTKKMFANALITQMKTLPFDKITIQMLSDMCNVRRQTFYYHFKDKHDLVTWIYINDLNRVMSDLSTQHWQEITLAILSEMDKKRSFYKNAYKVTGQNSLLDYLIEYDVMFITELLKSHSHIKELDSELAFALHYHSYARAHMTKQWMLDPKPISPKEFSQRLLSCMPETLRSLLP